MVHVLGKLLDCDHLYYIISILIKDVHDNVASFASEHQKY